MQRDDDDKRSQQSETPTIATTNNMSQEFLKATLAARDLTNLASGDQLMLYGLYKQATVGNCRKESEPSRFHVVAHAKYEAWCKFKDLTQQEAMQHYIEAVAVFASGQELEQDVVEELDLFNAMGVRPSTLLEEIQEQDDRSTPAQQLRYAARTANLQDLSIALAHSDSIIVNGVDDSGQSALHFAADRGFLEGVQALLEAEADPNAADMDGIGVLQAAVIAGHIEVAALLLKMGADPDQEDVDGDTPRSCAQDDGSEAMKQLFETVS